MPNPPPFENVTITSRVADIFSPPDNALVTFVTATWKTMNSNTFLLKGESSLPFDAEKEMWFLRSMFSCMMEDSFLNMFLEFDRLAPWSPNYHEWNETGPQPWPEMSKLFKHHDYYSKLQPMSVLGFVERLHWMLRTCLSPYKTHVDEATAQTLIKNFLTALFGEDSWNIDKPLPPTIGIPKWIEHPWTFYSVTPDFLHSTGYWNEAEKGPEDTPAYFESGENDSCTFFYKDTTFYILLTD